MRVRTDRVVASVACLLLVWQATGCACKKCGQPSGAARALASPGGQWIIGVDPVATTSSANPAGSGNVVRRGPGFLVVQDLSPGDVAVASARPGVRYVEPNYTFRALVISVGPRLPLQAGIRSGVAGGATASSARPAGAPNDPLYDRLQGMRDVDAPARWATGDTAGDAVVAVVDSGVNPQHPDLAANLAANPGEVPGNGVDDDRNGYVDDVLGYDVINRDPDPTDDFGHGTHVAGTVAAVGDNQTGVTGVCWRGQVIAVKVLDGNGEGSLAGIAEGIRYAADRGAKVINLSLGATLPSPPQTLLEAARYAGERGAVLVCAAGNENHDNDGPERNYPSSLELPNVVSVLATEAGRRCAAPFSNYGARHVHVGAPGGEIWSTVPDGYQSMSGTSMAAPHVAGALALVWNDLPGTTAADRTRGFLARFGPAEGELRNCVQAGRYVTLSK
jgi:subtilisin family serine protease